MAHPTRTVPGPVHDTGTLRTNDHLTPATEAQFARLKRDEAARQRWDPDYLTAKQAADIPDAALEARPELLERIKCSEPDWPENKLAASQALGDLPTDEGQRNVERMVDTARLFSGDIKGALGQE